MCRTLQPLPEAIKDAIKKTNLAYLFSKTEAVPHVLKERTRVTTYGSVYKGELVRGVVGSIVLPEGTRGWVFEFPNVYYSKYVQVLDMDYPAKGATAFCNRTSYQFVTLVDLAGESVLAESFKTVEHDPPRVLDTVA